MAEYNNQKSSVDEKLKGTENYATWAIEMELRLVEADLWDVVKSSMEELLRTRRDTQVLQKKNEKARAKILLGIDKSMYLSLKVHCNARDLWLALQNMFQDSGLERKLYLRSLLYNLKFEECKSVPDYLNKAISYRAQLIDMGVTISEEDMACLLLMKLPKSYRPLVLSLGNQELTVELVQGKLLAEESHIKMEEATEYKSSSEGVFLVKHGQKKYNNKEIECYNCRRKGHIAKWCRFNKNSRYGNPAYKVDEPEERVEVLHCVDVDSSEDGISSYVNTVSESNGTKWVLDSGAGSHLTNEESILSDTRVINTNIYLANNKRLNCTKVGNVNMKTQCGTAIKFENVKYVPELKCNLLSVARLTDKGCNVAFGKHNASIYNKFGKLIATASLTGGLYLLDIKEVTQIDSQPKSVPIPVKPNNASQKVYVNMAKEIPAAAEDNEGWTQVVNRRRYINRNQVLVNKNYYQPKLKEDQMLKKKFKKHYNYFTERNSVSFGNFVIK